MESQEHIDLEINLIQCPEYPLSNYSQRERRFIKLEDPLFACVSN